MADGHRLLGCGLRHQGLPPPLEGVRRGSRRERVERLRPRQRAVAIGLQRGEVRRTRLQRHVAHGARDRGCSSVGDHDPPRGDQDQHRQERPHGPERRTAVSASRERTGRLRAHVHHESRESGATDPHRRPAQPSPCPDRSRRQGDRPGLAATGHRVPARPGSWRGSRPTPSVSRPRTSGDSPYSRRSNRSADE